MWGLILSFLFLNVYAQEQTCPTKSMSIWSMVSQNLWNTLGAHVFVDWLPVIAYGTNPKAPRCAQARYRHNRETCGDLNVGNPYQALVVFARAYGGFRFFGLIEDLCMFDACPFTTTIATSKHVDFRTIDCRRATMTLECAWYQIPMIFISGALFSFILFASFVIVNLR